jgi:magnesium transporter
MIRGYALEECRLAVCEDAEGEIILCLDPDDAEKGMLIERYALDEHTLNSALDPNELSRIETEPSHTALIFKIPKNYDPQEEFEFHVTSLGLFLFEKRLIIVASEDMIPFTGKTFARLERIPEIMLKILNASISHFRAHLQVIDRVSEELADRISTAMENKYLLRLFALEKSLVYYLNAMTSNSGVLERMKQHAQRLGFHQDDRDLLDDIIIENQQCFKQAKMHSNILSSMMDARVSIVNNNLSILMKRLNILTIAIMVPTLVVSIFSMNVTIPLQKNEFAFWIILSLSFVSMAGVLLFWKFKK